MKSWEWEQMIREDATQEGLQLGLQQGQQIGLQQGLQQGRTEARKEDIKIFIETCREFGASKEDTISKLAEKYHLSADDTQNYIANYWT